MSESTQHLFDRYQHGDDSAADQLFYRYLARLTALARTRLSPSLARRVDPEDVVMSAYRSFFVGARGGEFAIRQSGDLWSLLVRITLRKLYRSAAHHSAQRRDVGVERDFDTDQHPAAWLTGREPTPDEAVAVSEQLKALLNGLNAVERRMLELRLLGESLEDIATATNRSERTVRRVLKRVETELGSSDNDTQPGLDVIEQVVVSAVSQVTVVESEVVDIPSVTNPVRWDDFVLQKQIGFGGMAKVYRAWQSSADRPVAVKFLRKSFLRQPLAIRQFLNEARLIEQLRHPNIVSIFGLGQTPSGGYFIAMKLIEMSAARLDSSHPSIAEALKWTADAATGIQHAHDHGVVHCDLKPSNILIAQDRAIVTDFGLARALADHSSTLSVVGTAPFMAPEQIDAAWGSISERTDVYGLGAVLFTLLTGRPPSVGTMLADILTATVSGHAMVTPSELNPKVGRQLDSICQRCLARNPSDRFATADDLRSAVLAAANPDQR